MWLGLFAIWAVILSGIPAGVFGGPGLLQWMQLRSLKESKAQSVSQLELDVSRVASEIALLDKNRAVQRREIRRILGYTGRDEIVFDFSSTQY